MSANAANKTTNDLKKLYGKRVLSENIIDSALAEAMERFRSGGAGFVEKHNVRFSGEVDGKRITSVAEIVFARFGQAGQPIWVAFCVFDGGWTNVFRPFTAETATMAWLEAYITKELAG